MPSSGVKRPSNPIRATFSGCWAWALRAVTQRMRARTRSFPRKLTIGAPRSDSSSTALQPGVQQVAEGVAEHVEAEDGEGERDGGPDGEPGRAVHVVEAVEREHAAPRRMGRRHAEAEEREAGLGEDDRGEAGRGR